MKLIEVVRFPLMDSICLGGSGRFQWIRWDDLKRLTMDLGDRSKLIFVGFGRFRWIRAEMATYLGGSGKIWMALSGFDRVWADLVGFGWIWLDLGADSCGFIGI